jgi:hypothetical protein
MTFVDLPTAEAGALKLAIDVAGEDRYGQLERVRPAAQDGEACMRHRLSVQGQAMAVEAPGQARVGGKSAG